MRVENVKQVCANKQPQRQTGTLLSFLPLVPFSVAERKAFEERRFMDEVYRQVNRPLRKDKEVQHQVTWTCQAEGLWLVLRKISG